MQMLMCEWFACLLSVCDAVWDSHWSWSDSASALCSWLRFVSVYVVWNDVTVHREGIRLSEPKLKAISLYVV